MMTGIQGARAAIAVIPLRKLIWAAQSLSQVNYMRRLWAEGVKMSMGPAALLSSAIVLAAFILGGRFAITDPVRAGLGDTVIVFRMDRLTGSVSRCNTEGCERLPEP